MEFVFERKVNYYETDKMQVVHHSNYVRYMEEARCAWLEEIDIPFALMEKNNVTIPVLSVSCSYKYHITYGDVVMIKLFVKEFTGTRMKIGYEMVNKETGKVVFTGESEHCFTNSDLKPINLKKYNPEFSNKFQATVKG